jgi:hypothetical protein
LWVEFWYCCVYSVYYVEAYSSSEDPSTANHSPHGA